MSKKFLSDVLIECGLQVSGTTSLGTATATTVATSDNSTNIATTAWVKSLGYSTTDSYVSGVSLNGNLLSFTGVNSAFTGSIDLSSITSSFNASDVTTVYERIKNVSGNIIYKGTPLAVVPGQTSGNISDVVPADASDSVKMPAIFIANEDIADQAEGEAVLFGNLTGVDTSLYQSGTTVYVAPGGGWTATKPVWPNLIQNLGVITKQHPTNGAGIVTGVGRANSLPNLTAGKIWVGTANYPIESTTVHVDETNARVGIGTTSPNTKLHIEGASADGTPVIRVNSTAAPNVFNYAGSMMNSSLGANKNTILLIGKSEGNKNSGYIGFRHTGIDGSTDNLLTFGLFQVDNIMNINGAGNVGIGTTAPTGRLHVNGGRIVLDNLSTLQSAIQFNSAGTEKSVIYRPSSSNSLHIYTAGGGDVVAVTQEGRVGIGTINPAYRLDVSGAVRLTGAFIFDDLTSNLIQHRAGNDINTLVTVGHGGFDHNGYLRLSGADVATQAWVTAQGYITSETDSQTLSWDAPSKTLEISNGNTVTLDGLTTEEFVTSQGYITGYTETDTLASVTGRGNSTTGRINVRGVGNQGGGNIMMGNTGDGTLKWSYLTGTHYNADSQPQGFALIGGLSTASYNAVVIGGNIYETNPATQIEFWTHNATTHTLGGTQRGIINSSGDWGIGTTAPASYAKLTVNGNVRIGNGASDNVLYGGFEGAILNQTAYQGYNIVYSGGDFQSVKLGGTNDPTNYYYNTTHVFGNRSNVERMRITDGGNVGIGTTNPTSKLQVSGNIDATGVISQTFWTNDSIRKLNAGAPLNFRTAAGTIEMILDGSGNLGIGTTSPAKKLHISTGTPTGATSAATNTALLIDSSGDQFLEFRTTAAGSGLMQGTLYTDNGVNAFIGYKEYTNGVAGTYGEAIHIAVVDYSSSDPNNGIYLGTTSNATLGVTNPQMFIKGNGNVGIGTTNPGEKLHVVGKVRIDSGSTSTTLQAADKTASPSGAIIDSYAITSTYGAFVDYVIYDSDRNNMRVGTMRAVWNVGDAVYTDVSTVDIGDTSGVTLTAVVNGSNVNIVVTGDSGFTIKASIKVIR